MHRLSPPAAPAGACHRDAAGRAVFAMPATATAAPARPASWSPTTS